MSTKVYEAAKGKTTNGVRVKAKALLHKDDRVDEVCHSCNLPDYSEIIFVFKIYRITDSVS